MNVTKRKWSSCETWKRKIKFYLYFCPPKVSIGTLSGVTLVKAIMRNVAYFGFQISQWMTVPMLCYLWEEISNTFRYLC